MKLCFVAHFALRALTGQGRGHIGGVERQTALMARWLVERGHSVSVIVWDEGQADEIEIDGIRILKTCPQNAGLPGLRFFVPRWSGLNNAMKRADANVYYHNCAEYVTGQVAMWARQHNRKFVYSVASDPDCDPRLPTLTSLRERLLYGYGLRNAHSIIVQTTTQKAALLKGFSLESEVLAMPCDSPVDETARGMVSAEASPRILWIGRLSPEKRAHLIIDVARSCPQFEFDIVGPDGTDTDYLEEIHRKCLGVENINLVGAVNFSEVLPYYKRATVLCCTSEYEGFPNTFLEAWSQGLPVVSTVDPDRVIRSHNLGRIADEPEQVSAVLAEYLQDDSALRESAENAITFYSGRHEKNIAMKGFEALLQYVNE